MFVGIVEKNETLDKFSLFGEFHRSCSDDSEGDLLVDFKGPGDTINTVFNMKAMSRKLRGNPA